MSVDCVKCASLRENAEFLQRFAERSLRLSSSPLRIARKRTWNQFRSRYFVTVHRDRESERERRREKREKQRASAR